MKRTLATMLLLALTAVTAHADATTNSKAINQEVPRLGKQGFFVTISGAPAGAIITQVEAAFSYIAYNGVEEDVSVRFNRRWGPEQATETRSVRRGHCQTRDQVVIPTAGLRCTTRSDVGQHKLLVSLLRWCDEPAVRFHRQHTLCARHLRRFLVHRLSERQLPPGRQPHAYKPLAKLFCFQTSE